MSPLQEHMSSLCHTAALIFQLSRLGICAPWESSLLLGQKRPTRSSWLIASWSPRASTFCRKERRKSGESWAAGKWYNDWGHVCGLWVAAALPREPKNGRYPGRRNSCTGGLFRQQILLEADLWSSTLLFFCDEHSIEPVSLCMRTAYHAFSLQLKWVCVSKNHIIEMIIHNFGWLITTATIRSLLKTLQQI